MFYLKKYFTHTHTHIKFGDKGGDSMDKVLTEQVGVSEFRFSAPMQKLRVTWHGVAGIELGGAQGFAGQPVYPNEWAQVSVSDPILKTQVEINLRMTIYIDLWPPYIQ